MEFNIYVFSFEHKIPYVSQVGPFESKSETMSGFLFEDEIKQKTVKYVPDSLVK